MNYATEGLYKLYAAVAQGQWRPFPQKKKSELERNRRLSLFIKVDLNAVKTQSDFP